MDLKSDNKKWIRSGRKGTVDCKFAVALLKQQTCTGEPGAQWWDCRVLVIMWPVMYGSYACWPFAGWMSIGCIGSCCLKMVHGTFCPSVMGASSQAHQLTVQKNRSPGFFETVNETEGATLYVCSSSCKFVFYSKTERTIWRISMFWSRSRLLHSQCSSGTDTYRMKMLNGVANIACSTTLTWYLWMRSCWMSLPLRM